MKLLDLSNEQLPVDYYLPSKTVGPLAQGETGTVRFQGLNAGRFGVTRVVLHESGANYNNGFGNAWNTSVTVRVEETDDAWFREVNGQSVTNLFRYYEMQVPKVLEAKQTLEVSITNNQNQDNTYYVALIGLTEPQLAVREETIRRQLGFMPEKKFAYVKNDLVPANTTNQPRRLIMDPEPQVIGPFGVATDGALNDMTFRVTTNTETLLSEVNFIDYAFVRDQVLSDAYMLTTERFDKLTVELSNNGGSEQRLSVMADTLPVRVLDALGRARRP